MNEVRGDDHGEAGNMEETKGGKTDLLKDHFHGFWELHENQFPEELREGIQEAVKKAIRCGTRDMPDTNVWVVRKESRSRYSCVLRVRAGFVTVVERNTRMSGQRSRRNEY